MSKLVNPYQYCNSLTQYSRRKTIQVNIGDVPLGSDYPIRIQSMTTIDTMDTLGSVAQAIRMIEAGCEYVRITAPSVKEAQNLENIKKELRKRGYTTPLVADIHFTPNAAELAARIVEKVRINPGNYADKKRFETIEYTEASYQAELERIRAKFIPLIQICKEYGTAMRIGTNHGSLSDRIMSRYGDSPIGMVESALEFLRICEELNYYNIVISMKSSNPQVMVQAYRLLVHKLDEEGLKPYPLHLGVTEAGDGEDGRVKSALGIGTLLEDGLGDTIRVSLTEEPEFEIPVAQALVERYTDRANHDFIPAVENISINPFQYQKRKTQEVFNLGAQHVPRVITDFSQIEKIELDDLKSIGHFYLPLLDKWKMNDLGADFIYVGNHKVDFMLPNGLKGIQNFYTWLENEDQTNYFPLLNTTQYWDTTTPTSEFNQKFKNAHLHKELNFLQIDLEELFNQKSFFHQALKMMKEDKTIVFILKTNNQHGMPALRRAFFELMNLSFPHPVIIQRDYSALDQETFVLHAATDIGGLLIDGLGEGIFLKVEKKNAKEENIQLIKNYNQVAFNILQAARTRITKTEYISCPSCGRTLFDLQETTAMIRKRTDHLKGVKIAIMGCVVNGPGEMADADYGYVGSGKDRITLYRGQNIVKRSVLAEKAVDELIEIIREDGKWIEIEQEV